MKEKCINQRDFLKKAVLPVLTFAIILCGCLFSTKQVYAASKLVHLKPNKIYRSYDFTRDGKPDVFKYTITRNGSAYANIYINGKYRQTIYMVRGGWLDYVKISKNNTCLVATRGAFHGNSLQAYYYSNKKFREVKNSFKGIGDYASVKSVSGSYVTIETHNCRSNVSYDVKYKVKNGKFTYCSKRRRR